MFNADLLYCGQEHAYKRQKIIGDNVFEDLKISGIFEFCAPLNLDNINARDIRYSLEVLKKPCEVKKDILYRQQIFKNLLACPGFASDLYENLQDVNVLTRIRETYDFDYGGETGIEYLQAVNYIFFIKSYILFIENMHEMLKGYELFEGGGLRLLFDGIQAERAKFAAPEITEPIEQFLSRFASKQNITGELRTQSGVFNYFNFDWDPQNIKCSYEEATQQKRAPFFELLKNIEDFLDIYKQEYEIREKGRSFRKRNGQGEELYTPEKYTNFEKHFILQLIYDEEAENNASFEPLVKRILEIHDSIDIECFVKLAGQIRFYRAVCKIIGVISGHINCAVCYPEVAEDAVRFEISGIIDTVIAAQKLSDHMEKHHTNNLPDAKIDGVIPNDIKFGEKQLFVVTGPNNGGKTAFARALGTAAVFFGAGAPIFAERAVLPAGFDVLTHFTASETHAVESGRLAEELRRLERVVEAGDEFSLVILNETFAGTNSTKALELFRQFLGDMGRGKFLCVYVTHFHNIAFYVEEQGERLPECGNLIALIDPDAHVRTYKVLPANPSDTSYSRDIVIKHELSWEQISARLNIGGGPA